MVDLKIPIPVKALVEVRKGAMVERGDVLAKIPAQKLRKEFDLAKILNVKPLTVRSFLKFELGRKVKEDDLIAEKKSLLGRTIVFKTPLDGILKSLSTDGKLVIEQIGKPKLVKSPLKGQVFALDTAEIVLKVRGIEIAAQKSFGRGWVSASLVVLTKKGEKLDFSKLNASLTGKIVAGAGPLEAAVLIKADTLGIGGIVVDTDDEKKMELAKTPILVLGKEFDKLLKYNQQEAVMDLQGKRIVVIANF